MAAVEQQRPNQQSFDNEDSIRPQIEQPVLTTEIIVPWAQRLPKNSKKVADLCGGQGVESAILSKLGFDCTVIDTSSVLTRKSYHHKNIRASVGDVGMLFERESVAGALLKDAIIFLDPETRSDMMNGLRQVLVTGGSLLVVTQTGEVPRMNWRIRSSTYGEWPMREVVEDLNGNWRQIIARVQNSPDVTGIDTVEFSVTPEILKELGEKHGFDYKHVADYDHNSPIYQEKRWAHKTSGFVCELQKR